MRFLRSVRPLEWGLVAFAMFVVVRAGPSVFAEWRELAGLRTVTTFCALGVVGAVRLTMVYRRLQWPVGSSGPRRLVGVLFPMALIPLVASAVLAAQARTLWAQVAELRVAQALPVMATVLLRVLGFGLPTLVTWLSLAIDVKRRGTLDSRGWLRAEMPKLLVTLRAWTPFLLVLSAYAWLDAAVGGKLGPDRDPWMAAADRALFFGRDPLDLLEQLISRPLSEWLAFAYSFYAVLYPLVFGAVFLFHGNETVRRATTPVGLALLGSYVSYSLIPVKGPLLSRTFPVSLELYVIGPLKEAMMDVTRITFDCFPSMHTACTMIMAWLAWRYVRRLFWWIVPVVVSMPLACVYLRYHYVVDVIAGLAVAAVAIAIDRRINVAVLPDGIEETAPSRAVG